MSGYSQCRLVVTLLALPFFLACHKSSSSASDTSSSTNFKVFLYAANHTSGDISQYLVNSSTGILTSIASNVPAHTQPTNIAAGGSTTPFLYVINWGSNDISGYSVNPATGALTSLAGSPFPTGLPAGTNMIAGLYSGDFLYATNQSTNKIYAYSIDQTSGALTLMGGGGWNTGSTPADILVDFTNSHIYVVNNGSSDIYGYSVTPGTGALTAISGSPWPAGVTPNGITAAGPYIFVASTGSSQIVSYMIDSSTGALTAASGSPFGSSLSYVVGVSPSAQFVYVQGGANAIEGHVADSNGNLSNMTGSPFSVGSGPNGGFAFHPTAYFTYSHGNDGAVYAFGVNPVTGALTALSTPSFAGGTGSGGIHSLFMGEIAQ